MKEAGPVCLRYAGSEVQYMDRFFNLPEQVFCHEAHTVKAQYGDRYFAAGIRLRYIYAAEKTLKSCVPEVGHDIQGILWITGSVVAIQNV